MRTPVHMATATGHADVARVLCDAGADTDKAAQNGVKPLYVAAYKCLHVCACFKVARHHPSKAEARATVICQYPLVPGHCARKLPSRTGPLRQDLAVRFAHEGVSRGRVRRRQLGLIQLGRPCLQLGLMQLGLMQLGLMQQLGGLMQLGRPWRKRTRRLAPAGCGSKPQALPCALTVCCGG